MEHEIWKAIPGAPGYEASNLGRVRSFWVPHPTRPYIGTQWKLKATRYSRCKYEIVGLTINGKPKHIPVHRLVLLAFVGEPGPEQETRHLDGNRANNVLSNLCWGTPKENAQDRFRHGYSRKGSRMGNTTLTEATVAEIHDFLSMGLSQRTVAAMYGIGKSTVGSIAVGKTWKHVPRSVEKSDG